SSLGSGLNNTSGTVELRDNSNAAIDSVSYTNADIEEGKSTKVNGVTLSIENIHKYSADNLGTPAHNSLIAPDDYARVRVHQKHDLNANGQLDWSEAGQHVAGWTIRLYDSTFSPLNYGDSGNEVVTTDQPYNDSAEFRVPPNQDYIVCEVKKEGFTPSFRATITSWVTWDDNSVDNNSSQSDEAEKCIEFTAPAANKVMTHAFGSIPTHDVPAATTQTDEVVVPGDFANEMGTWTYQNDINSFAYPDQ